MNAGLQHAAFAHQERRGGQLTRGVGGDEQIEIPGPTPGRMREVSRELLAHIIEQRLDEMFGLVYEALENNRDLRVAAAIRVFGNPIHIGQGICQPALLDQERDQRVAATAIHRVSRLLLIALILAPLALAAAWAPELRLGTAIVRRPAK